MRVFPLVVPALLAFLIACLLGSGPAHADPNSSTSHPITVLAASLPGATPRHLFAPPAGVRPQGDSQPFNPPGDDEEGVTRRISIAETGDEGNNASDMPGLSGDGRWVAFSSAASNLVANDRNAADDIFLHDRLRDTVTLISQSINSSSTGSESAIGHSRLPRISADGTVIAFESFAYDLVPDDGQRMYGIFWWQAATSTVQRVMPHDGTIVNAESFHPALSADGQVIAFSSLADNWVTGDTNEIADIFVYEIALQKITRVSLASDGAEARGHSYSPTLSADGRYVAFVSDAPNLTTDPTNVQCDIQMDGSADDPCPDVYLHDRLTGKTVRASIPAAGAVMGGASYAPAISKDGTLVAFVSEATLAADDNNEFSDIYLFDEGTNTTRRLSISQEGVEGDGASFAPVLTADGSAVVFWSLAQTLGRNITNSTCDVNLDLIYEDPCPNVLRTELVDGRTIRASLSSDGGQSNNFSPRTLFPPAVNATGDIIAFTSYGADLVPGDTNNWCLRGWGQGSDANCADVLVRQVGVREWRMYAPLTMRR